MDLSVVMETAVSHPDHWKIIPLELEKPRLGEHNRAHSEGTSGHPRAAVVFLVKDTPRMPLAAESPRLPLVSEE